MIAPATARALALGKSWEPLILGLIAHTHIALTARRILRRGDPELRRLAEFVPTDRLALDIGANRGVYSYWLTRLCPAVWAFEPNPDLADMLRSARLKGLIVHQAALSDQSGGSVLFVPQHKTKRRLNDPGGTLNAGSSAQPGARFQVRLTRLDDLAPPTVGFIKIDVEGHEEKALDGAMATINRDRPTLLIELEERHNPGCVGRVAARLAALGYQARFLDQDSWRPMEALKEGQIGPSGRYINNFLFSVSPPA